MVIAAKRFIHQNADCECVRGGTVKEPSSLPIFIQVALNEISEPGQNFCEHKLRVMSFSVHSRQGIGSELSKLSQKALS